ncbi:Uncharacterized protein Fot_53082 [Forsythia ovata]|uniref:Uncharacterized protein n=1 Tax=Forsythia ovata TaxID=205694 RepID=A0ABD1PHN1_9LAMI
MVEHSSSYLQYSSSQKFKLLFTSDDGAFKLLFTLDGGTFKLLFISDGGVFKLIFTTLKPPEIQAPIYSKKSWPQPIYFFNICFYAHPITNNILIHHNHQLLHNLCRHLEPNPLSLAFFA